jgi:type II secretory pathway pseudopilin PulG
MAGSIRVLTLPMKIHLTRTGFSLLETALFIGILSIISTTLVAVYISTQEARIRQKFVAEVEQTGTRVLETMTKNIRRAEKILAPVANMTGGILSLQMASNSEYPTIFASDELKNLVNVQKTSTAGLLTANVTMFNLLFQNVADANVAYSFDLRTTIPTIVPQLYSRRFSATVTLYPDDQSEAGGCGSCTAPVCTNNQYIWYHCNNGVCEQSDIMISC